MERKQWGKKIRAFRKLKGLTQADLAKEIGISLSILGEIERDNRRPTHELIQRISDTLKVSIDEFKQNNRLNG